MTSTKTFKTYMQMLGALHKNIPVSVQLASLSTYVDAIEEEDAPEKIKALIAFIASVKQAIDICSSRSRNTNVHQERVDLQPIALVSIEAIYFAKKLVQESAKESIVHVSFGEPKEKVLIISIENLIRTDHVCDGCNVYKPHEHTCHHGSMHVQDEPIQGYCECSDCRESETLREIGAFKDEDFMDKMHMFSPN